MARYECEVCGLLYAESSGLPEEGVAAGTGWDQLPEDWVCPDCGAPKTAFSEVR